MPLHVMNYHFVKFKNEQIKVLTGNEILLTEGNLFFIAMTIHFTINIDTLTSCNRNFDCHT